MAGLDFTHFYISHSIIHFVKQSSKKEKKNFFECIQQDFNIGELSPKQIIRFENETFRYIFFKKVQLEIIH